MSIVIPQKAAELEKFLYLTFNDIQLDPSKLKKALKILRTMCDADPEKRAVLSKFPAFEITPDALTKEQLSQLLVLTNNTPQATNYRRLRLWTIKFDMITKGSVVTSTQNQVLDAVIRVFFDALKAMREFKEGRWKFGAYIDRNEVNSDDAEKSGLGWHRDRFEDKSEATDYAQYTLLFLLTDQSLWKSGELGLQQGGEKAKDGTWINSKNPEIHLVPRLNQAIVVRNIDSAHCVAPLIPVQGLLKRDVFILTANYISK